MNHDEAKAVLLAEITRDPAPTRPQVLKRAQIALAVGGVLAVVGFAALGGMKTGARPVAFVIVCALALAVLAIRSSLIAVAAMAAIAVNYGMSGDGAVPPHADIGCALFTVVFSSIFGVASMVAFRSSDPIRPERRGMLLATTAVTLGAMFVFLVCPHESARHFAFAHIGTAVIMGGLLALVARRVVAVR